MPRTPQDLALLLQQTVDAELPHLKALPESAAVVRPAGSDTWSPKEELGHLIDSAANNHIRFVRGALETEFRGAPYAQNAWVNMHDYQGLPWNTIVDFWHQYNTLLARLVSHIPEAQMDTQCFIGSSAPVTLRFVIEDYVLHLRHHIDRLLKRRNITAYPGAAATI